MTFCALFYLKTITLSHYFIYWVPHITVNECLEENGDCSDTCENMIGMYKCLCPMYYKLDIDEHTCIDIDECAKQ